MFRGRFSDAVGTTFEASKFARALAPVVPAGITLLLACVPKENAPDEYVNIPSAVNPTLPVIFRIASLCALKIALPLSTPRASSQMRGNSPRASGNVSDGITSASFGYVAAENVELLNFRKTISDHSGITVFGMAAEGQKNGIPIAGVPAPKRTFKKMRICALTGIIPAFA